MRWYGLLIAIAVLLGLTLATRLGRARGIEPSLIADLLPLMVLGAVLVSALRGRTPLLALRSSMVCFMRFTPSLARAARSASRCVFTKSRKRINP